MNKKHRRILQRTIGGVLLGTSITAGVLLAGSPPSRQTPMIVSSEKKGQIPIGRCELPPAVGGMVCTPNARDHGYYEGTWRRWPTQTRMDQYFPEAVGATPITPAARHAEGTLTGLPMIPLDTDDNNGMGTLVSPDKIQTPSVPDWPKQGPGPGGTTGDTGEFDINKMFQDPTPPPGPGLGEGASSETPKTHDDGGVKPAGAEMRVKDVLGPAPQKGYMGSDDTEFEVPKYPPTMPEMKSPQEMDRSLDAMPDQETTGPTYNTYEANPLGVTIPGMETNPSMMTPASISTPTSTTVAPIAAPTALEGFCPVTLLQTEQWTKGDARYQVTYHGKTYLLSSQEKVQQFLADPRRYTPVLDGCDPVQMQVGRQVTGLADFCLVYEGRLYMFASEDSMNQFSAQAKDFRDYSLYAERLMQD